MPQLPTLARESRLFVQLENSNNIRSGSLPMFHPQVLYKQKLMMAGLWKLYLHQIIGPCFPVERARGHTEW